MESLARQLEFASQDQKEEQDKCEMPARREGGSRGSVEVQVSLQWRECEVVDQRKEDMMQARSPSEDVWHQDPPSRHQRRI